MLNRIDTFCDHVYTGSCRFLRILSIATRMRLKKDKMVVMIAGVPSHGYGAHEHYAGCRLLADVIHAGTKGVRCEVIQNGWPAMMLSWIMRTASSFMPTEVRGIRH